MTTDRNDPADTTPSGPSTEAATGSATDTGGQERPAPAPQQDTPQRPGQSLGILGTCRLGLRVLADELRWMVTGGLRGYESRQVRRRLEAEYAALGRLARAHLASGGKAPLSADGEAGIAMAQIDFLEQELEFMAEEARRTRKDMLARRRRSLDNDN
jgi:hypothetical protein